MKIKVQKGFTITAHTGCEGAAPNSIDSVISGIASGADIVEFDVRFGNSGIPVLSHDEPQDDGIITTFESALLEVKKSERVKMNIDLKQKGENLLSLQGLLKKHGLLERAFFTGVGENDVKDVKKFAPDIAYYINADGLNRKNCANKEYLSHLVKNIKDCGAIGINLNKKFFTAELAAAAHGAGLLISVWTINYTFGMKKALALCPDNITTKRPTKLIALINAK